MDIRQLYEIYLRHPSIVIDSRKATPGCLFFALRGEHTDGNEYAAAALQNGAAYSVVDRAEYAVSERCILADDVLKTLQTLATHHRRQFVCPFIAITGSNGKTTTKELVSAVLATHYKTHFTQGNLNNHIGLPLTLLAMPADTEIAVIEMGANHQGEIDFLCRIAQPTHGLITNIGKAHLEGFGGLEGVKKGKSELYRYLAETGGTAFVNLDETFLLELAAPVAKKVTYKKSLAPDPADIAKETVLQAEQPFLKVAFLADDGALTGVQSNLIGLYNFNNLSTAIAVGRYFKVPSQKILNAVAAYVPSNMRSQLVAQGSNKIILDAYNANPTSMRNALQNFAKMAGGTKVAILGAMLELGDESEKEHAEILELAKSLGLSQIVLVGKEFEKSATAAQLLYFENAAAAKIWFDAQNFQNANILIKGSRGIKLEKLLENV